jgi:polysaccharide deacetylase 2 family uncharacterized protein YibQ
LARLPYQNKSKNTQGGSRYAALVFLFLILLMVGGYFLFAPGTPDTPPVVTDSTPPPLSHKNITLPQQGKQLPAPPPITEQQKPPEQQAVDVVPPSVDAKILPVKPQKSALLAIIIDDMGTTVQEAKSLAAIGVPLTFSIIPGLRSFREVASYADSGGIETMIHIPMQSKGWPDRRLEANGLLVSMADKDIAERVEGFVRSIPKATGANNHTGSEFTEHEDKMLAVLKVLKGRGLFFVDSVTSPETVGEELAKELGMKSGRRQVFLDNEQNEAYILGQLNQAVRLAKRSGTAIAICHPHPTTIRTLEAALPALAKQGVTFVFASRLVK